MKNFIRLKKPRGVWLAAVSVAAALAGTAAIVPGQASAAPVLTEIRRHNPMLFDFVCKRSLRAEGRRLGTAIFGPSISVWDPAPGSSIASNSASIYAVSTRWTSWPFWRWNLRGWAIATSGQRYFITIAGAPAIARHRC